MLRLKHGAALKAASFAFSFSLSIPREIRRCCSTTTPPTTSSAAPSSLTSETTSAASAPQPKKRSVASFSQTSLNVEPVLHSQKPPTPPSMLAAEAQNKKKQQPATVVDGKQVEEPLWPNCDTIEEIIEEEKYGGGGGSDGDAAATAESEAANQLEPEHIVLALRAFLYGTILAFVGVGLVGLVAMKLCGFAALADVLAYVGSKDKRIVEQMRKDGIEVIEYNVDLTQPTAVPTQLSDLWEKIMDLSGVTAELEKAVAEAESGAAADNVQTSFSSNNNAAVQVETMVSA